MLDSVCASSNALNVAIEWRFTGGSSVTLEGNYGNSNDIYCWIDVRAQSNSTLHLLHATGGMNDCTSLLCIPLRSPVFTLNWDAS